MKSKKGISHSGEDFDPTKLPDKPEDTSEIRPAPAPGLPISQEEYERLKEEAETTNTSSEEKDEGNHC